MEIDVLMKILSQRVRDLRKRNKLSQFKLAKESDCSQTSVSHLENEAGPDRKSVTLELLLKVANRLGVTPWQLLLPYEIELPSKEMIDLIEKFIKSNQQGKQDILQIADITARYKHK